MKNVYAIRDRLAQDLVTLQMYSLITFKTHEQAARYFADGINDPSSLMAKHPADYELIHCGFVHDDGRLDKLEAPQIIITGDALIAVQNNKPELVKEA